MRSPAGLSCTWTSCNMRVYHDEDNSYNIRYKVLLFYTLHVSLSNVIDC